MSLADRATIGNMVPEYGATIGYFPIDDETLRYLDLTARDPHQIQLVETYAKEQGMFRTDLSPDPMFQRYVGTRSRYCRAKLGWATSAAGPCSFN